MGKKTKIKGRKAMSKSERKLAQQLGIAGLNLIERVTGLEIEGEKALAKAEVELASAIGSEGYVALRLGLAKEGRKALQASLKGLNTLAGTVVPVAAKVAQRAAKADTIRAKARMVEAEAQLRHAEAAILNAQTRAQEADIKEMNARTEAIKAAKLGLA